MRRREIEQLKQDFQELKARGFKRKPVVGETVKKEPIKEGPSLNRDKRLKWNEQYKKEGGDSEGEIGEGCEEKVDGI